MLLVDDLVNLERPDVIDNLHDVLTNEWLFGQGRAQ